MNEEIIRVENLRHSYPNGVEALCSINLTITRGEYVALVGQNGSGKTTLAKHFNGLLKPTSGEVWVKRENVREKKVSQLSRYVGYVFQNPDDMLFCSSVEEEIGFGPRMLGCSEAEIQQRVERTVETLGLTPLRKQHPFALSLGDRQRLAVACALSMDPEVFVFDEPTTGQDFFGSESIMAIIDQLHGLGRTILIITHDMRMVAEYASRVVVLSKGQVALDAVPNQAFTQFDLLEKLSLRPPQVTQLAHRLGIAGEAILEVNELCEHISSAHLAGAHPAQGG
jgi:energy-coupling factor transport system ATP-binding protein